MPSRWHKEQLASGNFTKLEPDLVRITDALRVVEGVEGRVFMENGERRISSVIRLKNE